MAINDTITALNGTVLKAANATNSYTNYAVSVFLPLVWEKFKLLLLAPARTPEMLWMVLPLAVMLLLMEFYFGRYKSEELGWNTAVGNSMVLVFVALDLFRHIYGDSINIALIDIHALPIKTIIAIVIALEGIWLLLVNYFHIIPKRMAFKLSSSLPINFTAYLGIILVYSPILDNVAMIDYVAIAAAAIILMILLSIVFGIIHFIEPKARDLISDALSETEKELEDIGKKN